MQVKNQNRQGTGTNSAVRPNLVSPNFIFMFSCLAFITSLHPHPQPAAVGNEKAQLNNCTLPVQHQADRRR